MDSSNAEKAWESWRYSDDAMLVSPGIPNRESFMAGRASRDAEVAEVTRLLAESWAANGDSEARRVELEAVIEKANSQIDNNDYYCDCGNFGISDDFLAADPSVLLEDRDREVAARAVEDAAPQFVDALDAHYLVDDKNLGYYRTEVTCACGASWWYGEHEGDPGRQEMWDKHRVEAITARAAAIRKEDNHDAR